MPRALRVEYPGAIYHVINRGDRREPIFKTDADREMFLACLDQCCAKTGWQVHAYVLMPNHFHLVIETPEANLVAGMKWFMGTYTNRFNRRHKLFGHLFSGRYKALLVDGSGNGYLKTVCDYVHLNPARAKLVGPRQALSRFAWSSWPGYLKAPSKRPAWLRVDRLLGEHGIPRDSPAGRRNLEARVEERRSSEQAEDYQSIRRGWCLGDQAFREELLEQMEGRMGAHHYAAQRREGGEQKARRLVAEELKRLNLKPGELKERRKGDPGKIQIAKRLRAETTVTLKWIARELHMGAWTHVSNLLSRERKK